MAAKLDFPPKWIIVGVIVILIASNVVTINSTWLSYQNSRFEGNVIVPSEKTDANWENGISRDGTRILFDFTVAREKFISDAKAIMCAEEKRRIRKYESTLDGWIIVEIKGPPLAPSVGYPNSCVFIK